MAPISSHPERKSHQEETKRPSVSSVDNDSSWLLLEIPVDINCASETIMVCVDLQCLGLGGGRVCWS